MSALDLADIQGGMLTAYGKTGFPVARYILFHFTEAAAGRRFVRQLRPAVTTALRWRSAKGRPTGSVEVPRPDCTLNLAFTFWGLYALELPTRTLRGLPDEFIDGMAARAAILGDDVGDNGVSGWDPVWRPDAPRPHLLVMLNAAITAEGLPHAGLERMTAEVLAAAQRNGLAPLPGHRGADTRWQTLSALFDERPDGGRAPTPKEHFGYTDALGDPVFDGQYPDGEEGDRAVGQGAMDGHGAWRPLATGEFLLGWPDEAQEVAGAAMPLPFSRNGSFFAYRKLHQHLDRWDDFIARRAAQLAAHWEIADPADAAALMMGKMAGRWPDGVPLSLAATVEEWRAFNRRLKPGSAEWLSAILHFGFRGDEDGARCPVTAHIRRANTRDMMDPHGDALSPLDRTGSALNNRRRILRRGLPYGARGRDDGEHGIVLLAHCASLARQFEFVQQQWMNYGLDFGAGNDGCPIVGARAPGSRFVIGGDKRTGRPPFIASGLPQFVSTRGGEYFFVPSMTALRMIGDGTVDPT